MDVMQPYIQRLLRLWISQSETVEVVVNAGNGCAGP